MESAPTIWYAWQTLKLGQAPLTKPATTSAAQRPPFAPTLPFPFLQANAFGTSVSAKALKYWQAVLVAAVFEFLGAVLLGANNTDTMKSGVADPKAFESRPEILM